MPLGTHGSSTNSKFLSVFFFPSDFDFSLPGGIACYFTHRSKGLLNSCTLFEIRFCEFLRFHVVAMYMKVSW